MRIADRKSTPNQANRQLVNQTGCMQVVPAISEAFYFTCPDFPSPRHKGSHFLRQLSYGNRRAGTLNQVAAHAETQR